MPYSGLKCSKCNSLLLQETHCGITLDRCGGCEGIWCDAGELEVYRARHPSRDCLSAKPWETKAIFAKTDQLSCPRCRTSSLIPGSAQGFSAFQCDQCKGAFVPGEALAWIESQRTASFADGFGDVLVELAIEGIFSLFDF